MSLDVSRTWLSRTATVLAVAQPRLSVHRVPLRQAVTILERKSLTPKYYFVFSIEILGLLGKKGLEGRQLISNSVLYLCQNMQLSLNIIQVQYYIR